MTTAKVPDLASVDEAGIHDWKGATEPLRAAASHAKLKHVAVDLAKAKDKATLFAELDRALALPDHFGHNWDALADLPKEARETLANVRRGPPFPYERDAIAFGNREQLLPAKPRGYYREYTVRTPGVKTRGARRIVCGGRPKAPDACWYTSDHYQSFSRIIE